jgi:hypothetical protein
MNIDMLSSVVCRVFFIGASLLLALGVLERVAFVFDYTITRGSITGGRLLEIAAVAVIFVIAILLRQIREAVTER